MYRINAKYPPFSYVRAAPSREAVAVRKLFPSGALADRVGVATATDGAWYEYEFSDKGRGWIRGDVHAWEEITNEVKFCDGFDSPVGTEAERTTAKVYPGEWVDSNPFGTLNYTVLEDGRRIPKSYHSGSDLNLNLKGQWNADAGMPLYAIADGQVITAARFDVWGEIAVIKHLPLPDGQVVYSRYAHMQGVDVHTWQHVTRGQQIGRIGDAYGRYTHHLHFDIVTTNILETKPQHWPALNKTELFRHYTDPKLFIELNHYLKYRGG